MTVSQAWLTAALGSAVEGPAKTERVALWIAGHYPADGSTARFQLNDVKDAIRSRSYTCVINALSHLQNDGLLEVTVCSDGLHYCVTSSHLIERIPNTDATGCHCDTKCDRSNVGETSHYTVSDTPLKGSMILVASRGSATGKITRKKETTYQNHKLAWSLWKSLGLGSGKAGKVAKNQGQSDENVKKKIEAIIAKHGWPIVEQVIHAEASDARTRGYSYNYSTFVRSHLTGLIEDAPEAPETALKSTNAPTPVSGVIDEVDRLVTGNEELSAIKHAYHREYRPRVGGGIDWVWKAESPQSLIDDLQPRIDSAKRMGAFGIVIVKEG